MNESIPGRDQLGSCQKAHVRHGVVVGTQRYQILQVVRSTLGPWKDVVHLDNVGETANDARAAIRLFGQRSPVAGFLGKLSQLSPLPFAAALRRAVMVGTTLEGIRHNVDRSSAGGTSHCDSVVRPTFWSCAMPPFFVATPARAIHSAFHGGCSALECLAAELAGPFNARLESSSAVVP